MKLYRLLILLALLLPAAQPARAQEESLSSIFTNAVTVRRPVIPPRRASIVFIACHGLRFGDLSCYGQTNFQTPNLDRLATEGTRFTDYKLTGNDLHAAQAALMAGNKSSFSGQVTLASRLQQAGYHTGLIGEWTLGAEPWTQGFDEFVGFINEQEARNYYAESVWRYAPKSDFDETNHTIRAFVGQEGIYANSGGRKNKYMPDVLMTAMNKFISNNQPDYANKYRPFFLLVNLPAPESVTPGKDDYPVPTDAPYTGEKWPQAAKNRAALLTRLDDNVGRLLELLDTHRMSNTVAIFFSGAVAPEPFANTNLNFLKVKGDLHNEKSGQPPGVPMIVRWKGHVPAGRVSTVPWTVEDFVPTVLQVAYVKPAANVTGFSILPELLGKQATNGSAPDHGKQP